MKTAISVKNLTKRFRAKIKPPGFMGSIKSMFSPTFRDIKAVHNISFEIKQGELVGFIGPNGAGKSTTIKMLSGILWPTSGKIAVLGMNPQKQREKLAYSIGTIFGQRQQLWLHLPAIDTFHLFRHMYEIPQSKYDKRLKELVELFEIRPFLHTPVRKLSLGQRMRCEFVAALLHNPKIIFLDEPTIGLDILAKKKLREHIKQLNQQHNTTVLLTSHDLEDIEQVCDRVILINKGSILYDDKTSKLRSKITTKYITVLFESEIKKFTVPAHCQIVEQDNFRIKLTIDRTKTSVKKVATQLFKKEGIADITIEEPPIEQVIEHLYT